MWNQQCTEFASADFTRLRRQLSAVGYAGALAAAQAHCAASNATGCVVTDDPGQYEHDQGIVALPPPPPTLPPPPPPALPPPDTSTHDVCVDDPAQYGTGQYTGTEPWVDHMHTPYCAQYDNDEATCNAALADLKQAAAGAKTKKGIKSGA